MKQFQFNNKCCASRLEEILFKMKFNTAINESSKIVHIAEKRSSSMADPNGIS